MIQDPQRSSIATPPPPQSAPPPITPIDPGNPYSTERRFREMVRGLRDMQRRQDAEFLQQIASQGKLHEFNAAMLQQAAQNDLQESLAVLQQGMLLTGEGWRVPGVSQAYGDLLSDLENQAQGQFPEAFSALRQQANTYGAIGGALAEDQATLRGTYGAPSAVANQQNPWHGLVDTLTAEVTMDLAETTGDRRSRALLEIVDKAKNLADARYGAGEQLTDEDYRLAGNEVRRERLQRYGTLKPPVGKKVEGVSREEYESMLLRSVVADIRRELEQDETLDPKTIAGLQEATANEIGRYATFLLPVGAGAGLAKTAVQTGLRAAKRPLVRTLGKTGTRVFGGASILGGQSATLFTVGAMLPTDSYQQIEAELGVSEATKFSADGEDLGQLKDGVRAAARFQNGVQMGAMMPMFALAGPVGGLAGNAVGSVASRALGRTAGNVLGHVAGGTAMGAAMPGMMELGNEAAQWMTAKIEQAQDATGAGGVIEDVARAIRSGLIADPDPIKPVQSFAAAVFAGDGEAMAAAAEEYARRATPAMIGLGAFSIFGAFAGVGAQNVHQLGQARDFNAVLERMRKAAIAEVEKKVAEMPEDEVRALAAGDDGQPSTAPIAEVRAQMVAAMKAYIDQQAEEARVAAREPTAMEQAEGLVPDLQQKVAEDRAVRRGRRAAGEAKLEKASEEIEAATTGADLPDLPSMRGVDAPNTSREFTADDLHQAARSTTSLIAGNPIGGDYRFISDVWKQIEAERPGQFGSLDEFKTWLRNEAREGRVVMSRADLVEAMDPETVRDSELAWMNARFHFVKFPEKAPAKAPPNALDAFEVQMREQFAASLPEGFNPRDVAEGMLEALVSRPESDPDFLNTALEEGLVRMHGDEVIIEDGAVERLMKKVIDLAPEGHFERDTERNLRVEDEIKEVEQRIDDIDAERAAIEDVEGEPDIVVEARREIAALHARMLRFLELGKRKDLSFEARQRAFDRAADLESRIEEARDIIEMRETGIDVTGLELPPRGAMGSRQAAIERAHRNIEGRGYDNEQAAARALREEFQAAFDEQMAKHKSTKRKEEKAAKKKEKGTPKKEKAAKKKPSKVAAAVPDEIEGVPEVRTSEPPAVAAMRRLSEMKAGDRSVLLAAMKKLTAEQIASRDLGRYLEATLSASQSTKWKERGWLQLDEQGTWQVNEGMTKYLMELRTALDGPAVTLPFRKPHRTPSRRRTRAVLGDDKKEMGSVAKALKSIVAQEDTRYAINGVLIDESNRVVYGTDGKRLFVVPFEQTIDDPALVTRRLDTAGNRVDLTEGGGPQIDRLMNDARTRELVGTARVEDLVDFAKSVSALGTDPLLHGGIDAPFNRGKHRAGLDAQYVREIAEAFGRLGVQEVAIHAGKQDEPVYFREIDPPDGRPIEAILMPVAGDKEGIRKWPDGLLVGRLEDALELPHGSPLERIRDAQEMAEVQAAQASPKVTIDREVKETGKMPPRTSGAFEPRGTWEARGGVPPVDEAHSVLRDLMRSKRVQDLLNTPMPEMREFHVAVRAALDDAEWGSPKDREWFVERVRQVRESHPRWGGRRTFAEVVSEALVRIVHASDEPRGQWATTERIDEAAEKLQAMTAFGKLPEQEAFSRFREEFPDLFEFASAAAVPLFAQGPAFQKKVNKVAVAIAHPNEGGFVTIPTMGVRGQTLRNVLEGINRIFGLFSNSRPAELMIGEAAKDPVERFTTVQRWLVNAGLANPLAYGGKVAADAIRVLQEAAGSQEQFVRAMFGDQGVFKGITENSAVDRALWYVIQDRKLPSEVRDALRAETGSRKFPRQYVQAAQEVRQFLDGMREAIVEVHPAIRRMRHELSWLADDMLKRDAEYQKVQAKRDQAKQIRDQMPEWVELRDLWNLYPDDFADSASPAELARAKQLGHRIQQVLEAQGLLRPEQYQAIMAGITKHQNRTSERRQAIAESAKNLADSWGLQDYLHHTLSPDADPLVVEKLFGGKNSKPSDYDSGYQRRRTNLIEEQIGSRRKVSARVVKKRTGGLEREGVVAESAMRSVWAYLGSAPIYAKRMEFLARWDEYLYGKLSIGDEIPVESGGTTHEAFRPSEEVVYDGRRTRSLGRFVSIPEFNDEREIVGMKYFRAGDEVEIEAWVLNPSAAAGQVVKAPWHKVKEALRVHNAAAWASKGAEERIETADFEGVLLWLGDDDAAPRLEHLQDPDRTKGMLASEADWLGNPRRVPKVMFVRLDEARQQFRFWRDGYYGRLLKGIDEAHRGDELLAVRTLADFVENQFLGGLDAFSEGHASILSDAAKRGEQIAAIFSGLLSMNAIGGPTNVRNAIQAGIGGSMFAYASMGRLPSAPAIKAMGRFGKLEKKLNAAEEGAVRKAVRVFRDKRGKTPLPEIAVQDGRILMDFEVDRELGVDAAHTGAMTEDRAVAEAVAELFHSHVMGGNRGDQLARNLMQALRVKPDGAVGKRVKVPKWLRHRERAQDRIERPGEHRNVTEWWKALNSTYWAPFNLAERYARAMPFMDVFIERRMGGASRERAAADAFAFVHATQMVYNRAAKPKLLLRPAGRLFGSLATWSVHAQGRMLAMPKREHAKLMGKLFAFVMGAGYMGLDVTRMLMSQSTDLDYGFTELVSGSTEGELLTGLAGGVGFPTDEDPYGATAKGPFADGWIPTLPLPVLFTGPGPFYDKALTLLRSMVDGVNGEWDKLDEEVGKFLQGFDPIVAANWFRRLKSAFAAEEDPDTGKFVFEEGGYNRKEFSDLAEYARGVGLPDAALPSLFWLAQQLPMVRETRQYQMGTVMAQQARYREGLEHQARRRLEELATAMWEAKDGDAADVELARAEAEAAAQSWAELRGELGQQSDPRALLRDALRRTEADAELPGFLRTIGGAGSKESMAKQFITALNDRRLHIGQRDVELVMTHYLRAGGEGSLSTLKPATAQALRAALERRFRPAGAGADAQSR